MGKIILKKIIAKLLGQYIVYLWLTQSTKTSMFNI